MYRVLLACILSFSFLLSLSAQKVLAPAPLLPVPTARQLAWHKMEMTTFVHFTTNTFTGKEWGFGDEKETVFNPTAASPDQWLQVFKNNGFKGVILTTKHHDGFCLWPSKYTKHSVKNSPYKNGKGDLVKETSDAAKKYGLKFGIYLSPWDRNHAGYGKPEYITYYRNQLKELTTNYGPLFEIWLDGANGGDGYYGGSNETRKINGATYYDWATTISQVRKVQPGALFFSDAGPDIRWVGNERGIAGETNWNTITPDTLYAGKPNINKLLNTGSPDGTKWIPAEVDVSIRPGWFYHSEEDSKVKTPEQLFDIYLSSVGRGSVLLLNIPPDRRGLVHENDIRALEGFTRLRKERLGNNLAKNAVVIASATRGNSPLYKAGNITDNNTDTYWTTDDKQTTGSIEIDLKTAKEIKYILLQEHIALGQRVESFTVEAWKDNQWQTVTTATTIGYKRILKIDPVTTAKLRVSITGAKACPLISNVALY